MNQDRKPKIILTRPEPGLTKFSGQLAQKIPSASVYCEALQSIDFVPNQVNLERYNGFVFTSSNGVRAAKRWGLPPRTGFGVGHVTTQLARSYCDPVHDGGSDVEALLALILSMKPAGPLLHIRGQASVGNLATRLSEHRPCSLARISEFAATPPATAKVGVFGNSFIYSFKARRVFSTRTSATAL